MAEHRESLGGRVSTEAEGKDVSERNYAEWEGNEDPLRRGILLIEDVEEYYGGGNRDVELKCVEDKVGDPI